MSSPETRIDLDAILQECLTDFAQDDVALIRCLASFRRHFQLLQREWKILPDDARVPGDMIYSATVSHPAGDPEAENVEVMFDLQQLREIAPQYLQDVYKALLRLDTTLLRRALTAYVARANRLRDSLSPLLDQLDLTLPIEASPGVQSLE